MFLELTMGLGSINKQKNNVFILFILFSAQSTTIHKSNSSLSLFQIIQKWQPEQKSTPDLNRPIVPASFKIDGIRFELDTKQSAALSASDRVGCGPISNPRPTMTTREVVLEGGSPWGFRIHGGVDADSPLRISRVSDFDVCT